MNSTRFPSRAIVNLTGSITVHSAEGSSTSQRARLADVILHYSLREKFPQLKIMRGVSVERSKSPHQSVERRQIRQQPGHYRLGVKRRSPHAFRGAGLRSGELA